VARDKGFASPAAIPTLVKQLWKQMASE